MYDVSFRDFKVLGKLGSGSFGHVYLVERRADGAQLVVKRVPCSNIIQANSALSEARVLLSLNHPHIVKYSNFFLEQAMPGAGISCYVCTVMEYCPGGDLDRLVSSLGSVPLPEEQLLVIARSVSLALDHLFQNSIIHRDLKPGNVFVGREGVLKVGDLGVARSLLAPADQTSSVQGTPLYMAPEVMAATPYSFPADMWSLGALLFELASGVPLMRRWEQNRLLLSHIKDQRPMFRELEYRRYTPGFIKMVMAMLAVNPAHRPTPTVILHSRLLSLATRDAEISLLDSVRNSIDLGGGGIRGENLAFENQQGPYLPPTRIRQGYRQDGGEYVTETTPYDAHSPHHSPNFPQRPAAPPTRFSEAVIQHRRDPPPHGPISVGRYLFSPPVAVAGYGGAPHFQSRSPRAEADYDARMEDDRRVSPPTSHQKGGGGRVVYDSRYPPPPPDDVRRRSRSPLPAPPRDYGGRGVRGDDIRSIATTMTALAIRDTDPGHNPGYPKPGSGSRTPENVRREPERRFTDSPPELRRPGDGGYRHDIEDFRRATADRYYDERERSRERERERERERGGSRDRSREGDRTHFAESGRGPGGRHNDDDGRRGERGRGRGELDRVSPSHTSREPVADDLAKKRAHNPFDYVALDRSVQGHAIERKLAVFSNDEFRKQIAQRCQGRQLNIYFIGEPGHGKSSLVNSLYKVFRHPMSRPAQTSGDSNANCTLQLLRYDDLPFVVWDTMGVSGGSKNILKQLFNGELQPNESMQKVKRVGLPGGGKKYPPHCVVLVVRGTLEQFPNALGELVRELSRSAHHGRIPIVGAVTFCDDKRHFNRDLADAVKRVSGAEEAFPISNYISPLQEPTEDYDNFLLNMMFHAVEHAATLHDYMNRRR